MIKHIQQITDYVEQIRKPVNVPDTASDLGLPEQTVRNVFTLLKKQGILKVIHSSGKVKIWKRTSAKEEARLRKHYVAEDMRANGAKYRQRIREAANA
jgi:Mn-dependent DtxR family transcriptional regulator